MKMRIAAALAALAPALALGQMTTSLDRPKVTEESLGVGPAAPGAAPDTRLVRKLKPLILVPELSLQISDQSVAPVPSMHAQGSTVHCYTARCKVAYGVFQYRLDLNPKPGAGDPVAVARRVRVTPGTVAVNVGYRFTLDPLGDAKANEASPYGLDLRVGLSGAAQTADVVLPAAAGTTPNVITGYTGMGSAEVTLALWLGHAYLAGQYSRFWAGGKDQVDLARALDDTENLTVSAIYAVQVNSDKPGEDPRPLYLQFGGSGKPDFSDTIWSFTLAMKFEPL